jgi:hypothetical protein
MKRTMKRFLNYPSLKAPHSVTAGIPTRQLLRRLVAVLTITWLGVSGALAADEAATNIVTYSVAPPVASPLEAASRAKVASGDAATPSAVSPMEEFSKHLSPSRVNPTPADHLQTIQSSFQQFLHWQNLLRLFLGFALAVIYSWLLSWSPRRPVRADPAAGIEEGKTLIVLGMLGAVVAEITKLSPTMAFVIFGIGSLVRFRTALDDPKLTGKAIMVVVIGLACGMDQWALGGFVTLAAWVLIYWLESHASVRLKVTVGKKQDVRAVYGDVQEFLRNNRCRVKAANLYENRRMMVFVTQVPAELNASEMDIVLHSRLAKAGEDCEIEVRVY